MGFERIEVVEVPLSGKPGIHYSRYGHLVMNKLFVSLHKLQTYKFCEIFVGRRTGLVKVMLHATKPKEMSFALFDSKGGSKTIKTSLSFKACRIQFPEKTLDLKYKFEQSDVMIITIPKELIGAEE